MMLTQGSSEASTISGLISLIANPSVAKQNLADLQQASADLQAKMEEYAAETEKQKQLDDSISYNADLQAQLKSQLDSLSTQQDALSASQKKFTEAQAAFNAQTNQVNSDLKDREDKVSEREKVISAKEAIVQSNLDSSAAANAIAQGLKDSLTMKLSQINSIAKT